MSVVPTADAFLSRINKRADGMRLTLAVIEAALGRGGAEGLREAGAIAP